MAEPNPKKLPRDPYAGRGAPCEGPPGEVSRRDFASLEWRRANPEAARRVFDGEAKLVDD